MRDAKTWITQASHSWFRWRSMVARHCPSAKYLAARLAGQNGITVLNGVMANQVAIACRDDAQAVAVLDRVQARGKVYPRHAQLRGQKIMRASIINHATVRLTSTFWPTRS
jgi:glutamate/tyrosine decarboxylase-like PLP-dependent enzyme